MIDIREIEKILSATLDRAHLLGYMGYSKFDGLHSPLVRALSFRFWPLRLHLDTGDHAVAYESAARSPCKEGH